MFAMERDDMAFPVCSTVDDALVFAAGAVERPLELSLMNVGVVPRQVSPLCERDFA